MQIREVECLVCGEIQEYDYEDANQACDNSEWKQMHQEYDCHNASFVERRVDEK